MARRTATAAVLLALIVPAVFFGGVLYFLLVGAFLLAAAWEYLKMFSAVDFRPSPPILLGGIFVILVSRAFAPEVSTLPFAAAVLAAMTVHLVAFERGRDRAAVDFGVTVGGIAYLGWIGSYILDLRALPNGGWWVMLVFPIVWLADSGAYLIGVQYGRHKMLPRLSPHKSWEGYWAGVVGGTLCGVLFAYAYSHFGPLQITLWQGAALGLILSVLTTLGDVGESLFKRFAGFKDSGSFLPGHGGAFDRIDSLMWAAVIGYYCIKFWLT
ncbi:MAG: phosphatidate cytidylyltransferase [Anaerolineales bacterium]